MKAGCDREQPAAVREELGTPHPAQERADVDQAVAPARATLGEELWTAAFAEGQALTLGQAIAEALGDEEVKANARIASDPSPTDPRATRSGR
jgi:hypothetical protein